VRGITLHQPYASLIALGVKTYETRSWATKYRGPLLIHAGKKWDSEVIANCRRAAAALRASGHDLDFRVMLGKVVCLARLDGCVLSRGPSHFPAMDQVFGDLTTGRYGWRLIDVHRLIPAIPYSGSQGLWIPSPALVARLHGPVAALNHPKLFPAKESVR
jgi:hypothetical protein